MVDRLLFRTHCLNVCVWRASGLFSIMSVLDLCTWFGQSEKRAWLLRPGRMRGEKRGRRSDGPSVM